MANDRMNTRRRWNMEALRDKWLRETNEGLAEFLRDRAPDTNRDKHHPDGAGIQGVHGKETTGKNQNLGE